MGRYLSCMASRTDQKPLPRAEEPSFTREELRRAVRRLGFRVTAAQLRRWHKADLLDRPVRRAKGRIEGSESRYPFMAELGSRSCRPSRGSGPNSRSGGKK